jgi:hypothetical protein
MAVIETDERRRRTRNLQLRVAGLALVVLVVLAEIGSTWPFESRPAVIETFRNPSVWQFLFSDRTVLGFARLAIAAASLFVILSVLALGVAGRWMSGFRGLTVDERESTEEGIMALEERLKATEARLDEETTGRQEAEDWASDLLDQLDQTEIELDHTREELAWAKDAAASGDGDDGDDLGGDSDRA